MWAISIIFKKLPKVNNRPLGENSPNLATLSGSRGHLVDASLSRQRNVADVEVVVGASRGRRRGRRTRRVRALSRKARFGTFAAIHNVTESDIMSRIVRP
jgi:hypothetical protein